MSVSLRPRVLAGLGIGLALLLAPPLARAGDGTHPRTPVLWDDPMDPNDAPACMTIVDRSVEPLLHLDYWIPYEDTELTADEVDDSRRHQAFAFCRHHSPEERLPIWISTADVDKARAKDLVIVEPGPEEILDTSAAWEGCFVRLIPDDQRRPITFEEAAKGIDWDTSAVPVGSYFVEGYTWEPPGNEWYRRWGVIKVVDAPDPAASPPAVAVDLDQWEFWDYETLSVQGCLSAMEGSTLTASWSFPAPLEWVPFAVDVPVAGDAFAVDFIAPPGTEGNNLLLRVDVSDPMGRSATAYANELVFVIASMGATSGGDCDATFIADPSCMDDTTTGSGSDTDDTAGTGDAAGTTDASAGSTGATAASTTAGHGDDGGGGGCHCAAGRPGDGAVGGLGLVALVLVGGRAPRRRRRRDLA